MLEKQQIVFEDMHFLDETGKKAHNPSVRVATHKIVLVNLTLEIDAIVSRNKINTVFFPNDTQCGQLTDVD